MLFGRSGKDYKEDRNITTFDYNDFLEASTFEGMSEVGMAKAGRHVNTDFGSPYRGPIISSGILQDQEILRERENYLRGQYHVKHFDPERGLFGINSPFERVSGFIPTSRSYNTSGERFSGSGLTGDNLRKINLSDGWDVAVEDADTVKIKRNGFLGAVSSFFGMNPEYSYRLEGIDAPEIQHAGESGSSFGREQPGGSASAVALRKMLEGRDVSLVVNPTDITYGRAVGVLFADGQNVNKQLVTSGRAASLSFYSKTNQAMQNFGAIEYQEELAAKSNRGIWSEPWMQAYRDFRETSGQSITFSTLAKVQKLGSNAALSGGLSLMQQAQASGMYNTAQAQGIAAQAKYYHGGTDDYSPIVMGAVNAHYDGYMTQLQTELNGYLTNKGRKQQHSLSSRDGYAQLDSHLAQQGIAGKRPPELRMAEIYDKQRTTKAVKRAQMQRAQQDLNHRIFTSPIGHHVM
jgi:endonuclease YncB( thermonuclease family)